jgi:hypothetical protein
METLLPQLPIKRLSQAQLNLLETCPPQFQRIYLEQLATPISPEQQEKLVWGSQFHHLIQQQELGLPIDSLLAADEQFQLAITALKQKAPELWSSEPDISLREAEHCRTLEFNGYLLTVVYDLLILKSKPKQAMIIDWKTYLQPTNKNKLEKNWQTRLYLYVLAETSDYLPQQISLTYWFVKLPHEPQNLIFNYHKNKHEKTKQDLTKLLNNLDQWLEKYYNKNEPFNHIDNCESHCEYYKYLSSLQKTSATAITQDWLINIDEIEEIPL